MFVNTTCRGCGERLLLGCANRVSFNDPPVAHDGCSYRRTRMEQLIVNYKGAIATGDSEAETRLELEIEQLHRTPPRLADAALRYAGWGWPVFPLLALGEENPHTGQISDGKKPATKHGFKNATTDQDRIKRWWAKHPNHNIGLATGACFDVVDIDAPKEEGKPDGRLTWARILEGIDGQTCRGKLPDIHGVVSTSSDGLHLYT